MKQQFDLSLWLQNKSRKVVTRNNIEVEIIHDSFPLVAIINGVAYNFYNDGKFQSNKTNHKYDLFFADKEEEPQSIEIPFGAKDSEFIRDEYYIPDGCEARIEGNKVIIERVQKEEELTEFEKEVDAIIDENIKRNIGLKYEARNLLNLARKEILKDLPKWKKATEHEDLEKHIAILEDSKVLLSNYLEEGDYYIVLDDLKILPKEQL